MDKSVFTTFCKTRPRTIGLATRNIIVSDFGTPTTATNREYYQRNFTPLRNEEPAFEDLIHVRKLTKSGRSTKSPSPINCRFDCENKSLLSPKSGDDFPLIFLKEPKIHTTKCAKKRCETPALRTFKRIKRIDWVFKLKNGVNRIRIDGKYDCGENKSRVRGKVRKGKCDYPRICISPVRFCNMKLDFDYH